MAEKMGQTIRHALTIAVTLISGFLFGIAYADKHPPMSSYQAPCCIASYGRNAICPEHHMCEWKAWDINDDREVPKENYLPEVKR